MVATFAVDATVLLHSVCKTIVQLEVFKLEATNISIYMYTILHMSYIITVAVYRVDIVHIYLTYRWGP